MAIAAAVAELLAALIRRKGDRPHQVIELTYRRALIVWPREW